MLATNPIDKDILDRAMAIIEQHLDDTEFNVNVFAREMAMARTNLFTKLKAITGQTPNDFYSDYPLKKGALMLRNNPELNITEISDRIGFSSSRYFSKCFKDVYHVSPLAYRKGRGRRQGKGRGRGAKNRFYMFWTFSCLCVCTILYTEVGKNTYLWSGNQTLKPKDYETFI